MRPEDELLLTCARLRLTDEGKARFAALLGQCEDWAYLRRAARRHGLLPLLYWHLRQFDREQSFPPPEFLSELQSHFQQNAKHNLFFTGELLKLLGVFRSHGVPCLTFKGPLQASLLYGNVALREFVDLDLLVREADLAVVNGLLAEQGYAPQVPLTPEQEKYYVRTHCERNYVRDDGSCFVDLHWAITDDQVNFALRTQELFGRLETATLGGTMVSTVAPEDHLLILSVHAAKDLFSRLESLCAVAELLRTHAELDWRRVLQLAAQSHSKRRLLLALSLSRELLDAPLPAKILERARRDRLIEPMSREVRARLFSDDQAELGVLERSRWSLRVLDRQRDGLGGIGKSIIRPNLPDWAALTLPTPLFFLYYLVRPVRLATKYLQKTLRRR